MLERPLDRFDELMLDLVKPPDVGPRDVRHFHEDLADRRGLDLPQGPFEVSHLDLERAEALVGNVLGGKVDLGQQPPQADHGRLAAQGHQISADEPVGDVRQVGKLDVRRQRHASAVDFENLPPPVPVGNRDRDFAIEAAWPPQGRIERIGQVRRRNDDHVLPLGQSVHQGQKLGHDPFLDVADDLLTLRRDRVDLVEKDDAGRLARGIFEDLPQVGFALAIELVDDLRTVDREETSIGLVGHRAGDQRLAATGRPVEQDALGRVDSQPFKHLGIAERQLDDLANAVQLALQAADILVRDSRSAFGLGCLPLGAARLGSGDLQDRPGFDHDRARRGRAGDLELGRPVAKKGGANAIVGQHGKAVEEAPDVVEIAIGGDEPQRRQNNPLRLTNRGFAHIDELVQRRTGVLASHAVDVDPRLFPLLLVRDHRLADGRSLADELDDVPDFQTKSTHVGGVEPGQSTP